jgi:Uma2 family endonuclease
VRLDRFNEPQPDLLLLRPRDDFYATRHPGPADVLLVIEISDSSLAYDRGRKAGLYAEWGVTEYWVADLPHNLLWRYVAPEDGTFRSVVSYGPGLSLSPHALPSCVVPAEAFLIGWQSGAEPTDGPGTAAQPT